MPSDILIIPNRNSTTAAPVMLFSGSQGNSIRMEVLTSGSIAFLGKSGSLFSINDSLSGSLMGVNDISGLPILEVFSDDRVVMGKFNTNALVVTGSRVGIGKATPNAAFDVSGSAVISGSLNVTSSLTVIGTTNFYGVVNSFNTQNSVNIYSSLSTNIGVGALDANVDIGVNRSANGNAYLNFVSEGTSGTYPFYGLLIAKLSGASGKSQLIHRGTGDFEIKANEAGAISLQTTATERLRILSGGNVGIGTSSPGFKLEVSGDTYSSTGFYVRNSAATFIGSVNNMSGMSVNGTSYDTLIYSGGNPTITVKSNGNVGIGKSTPNSTLDVNGNTIVTGSLSVTVGSGNAGININGATASDYASIFFYQASSGKWAAGVEATTSNFYISNAPGFAGTGYVLYLDKTNSRIAVNKTTAPNSTLDVNGNTIISGSLIVTGDVQADFTPMFLLMGG